VVLLMAKAQQIPTTTPASQGRGRIMVEAMVTRWCLREVSRSWGGSPCMSSGFMPSTGSLCFQHARRPVYMEEYRLPTWDLGEGGVRWVEEIISSEFSSHSPSRCPPILLLLPT